VRRVGFTASRQGPTARQFERLLSEIASRGVCEAHHGDCIGGDEEIHTVVKAKGWRVVAHPALGVGGQRAYCEGCDEVRDPLPPLDRNSNIIAETDEMIAMPDGPERLRSGTWSTIRRARKAGKPLTIIWPDGSVS
jgi:hypothetical protein